MSTSGKQRVAGIDGLRTLAVLMVFAVHVSNQFLPGGGLGVDIFFVISGFVITGLILNDVGAGRFRLGSFYWRRLVRLWPALIAVCAVCAVLAVVHPPVEVSNEPLRVLVALFYGMDITRAVSANGSSVLLGHTWSLGVEEQFYLVWPLLLLLVIQIKRSAIAIAVVVVLAVVPILWRCLLWQTGSPFHRIYNAPDTRADQLLIGCLLACTLGLMPASRRHVARATAVLVWPAWLVLIAVVVGVPPFVNLVSDRSVYATVGIAAVAVLAVIIVAGQALLPTHPLTRAMSLPAVSWPGKNLTYGFYLWHFPIVISVDALTDNAARWVPELLLSILAALVSWRFVERPTARWAQRRRLRNSSPDEDPNQGIDAHPSR
jgi:peptidoglycan/LPS O-acetylase OafA/YrhL